MAFGGENAESYHDEGLTAMMRGDLSHAVQFFTRAIQFDSAYLPPYHQLGKCYLRLGQAERAIEILQRVLKQKPNLIPARLDLGYAFLKLNDTFHAENQFRDVIAMQPENWRAHLGLAHAAFHAGQWDNAVMMAKAARVYGGTNFSVLFVLGRAAKLAGNPVVADEALQAAEALIEKSVEMSPDAPEGHFLRGEVALARDRFSAALDHYRAAEDRAEASRHYSTFGENFTRLDVMAKRGFCLHRLGSTENAREVGRQILAMAPNHEAGKTLAGL